MHRSEPPARWHLEVGPLGGDREGVAPGWDGRTCEDGVTALCPVGRASSRAIKPPSALAAHFRSSRTVGEGWPSSRAT